jgi:hypothetical protein
MMTDEISHLRAEVSATVMMRHLEEFSRRIKLSGTPEELESFHYLRSRMNEYGYHTDLISHPLISARQTICSKLHVKRPVVGPSRDPGYHDD